MAEKFIFEDHENTPSSQLLKQSYWGKEIYFSEGAQRLYQWLKNIWNQEDKFYIFVDVVPDNPATVVGYNSLVEMVVRMDNVHVIPILCVEYLVLKMLVRYGYFVAADREKRRVKYLIEDFNWKELSELDSLETFYSIEHVYKDILNNLAMVCTRNTKREKNELYGKFYISECDCDLRFCKILLRDSLKLKAERLYQELPYQISNEDYENFLHMLSMNGINITYEKCIRECQNFYNVVCKSMGLPSIKVH